MNKALTAATRLKITPNPRNSSHDPVRGTNKNSGPQQESVPRIWPMRNGRSSLIPSASICGRACAILSMRMRLVPRLVTNKQETENDPPSKPPEEPKEREANCNCGNRNEQVHTKRVIAIKRRF